MEFLRLTAKSASRPVDTSDIYSAEEDVKVKLKLSLCLTKHHVIKTYRGVEV